MRKIPKICLNRKLNQPWKSNRNLKKKQVCVKDSYTGEIKNIHFGDTRYKDYTQHKNSKRRKLFRLRHKCDPVSKLNKATAKYWSCKELW